MKNDHSKNTTSTTSNLQGGLPGAADARLDADCTVTHVAPYEAHANKAGTAGEAWINNLIRVSAVAVGPPSPNNCS